MEITLTDERIVNVLLIEFTKNYVDWKLQDEPGACRSDFEFVGYATLENDIKTAIENDISEVM